MNKPFLCSFLLLLPVFFLTAQETIPERLINSENGITRLIYPKGAAFKGGSRDSAALRVVLPVDFTKNHSFRMRLELYNRGKSATIWINAMSYNVTSGWLNPQVQIITANENQLHQVHFGNYNGSPAIWVGDIWIPSGVNLLLKWPKL